MSERKVIQDQRATENTMSSNMQSVLEHEYTVSFRDGTRVGAAEFILKKLQKGLKTEAQPIVDRLRASRLACLIFEVKIPNTYSIHKKAASILTCIISVNNCSVMRFF